MIPLLFALACGEGSAPKAPEAPPETCDAGDEAWVQRVIPYVWGRKPHGAAEVKLWAAAAERYGRDEAVRAMARDPAWGQRWGDWIRDNLDVARVGDKLNQACYAGRLLSQDKGELAAFLATTDPAEGRWAAPFTMADLIASALARDELSVIYRAHLFGRMSRPLQGANVGPAELEEARRTSFGESFFQRYLHRDLTCIACHNGSWSATGDPDPAKDRTWEIPGLFEQALLGSSFGRPASEAYAMFRTDGVLSGSAQPWGMSAVCGSFTPPGAVEEDDLLDHEAFFIEAFGTTGSVWDIERYLHAGVDQLDAEGLVVQPDGSVDGPSAFGWLVAETLADAAWEEATGRRLTVAHGFARNEAQRDTLDRLTGGLVDGGYSLVELVVNITTDPVYNSGAPASCEAQARGAPALLDPWTPAEVDPALRGNGAGDLAHRHDARTLVRGVHDAMDWPQPAAFPAFGDPMAELMVALGAYSRESQPGFRGTDLQGLLAFEEAYGACAQPAAQGAGDGCAPTPTHGGCAGCDCQDCVCAADPYCCDVQWDAACVDLCEGDCGGCGGGLAEASPDAVDQLLIAAADQGLSLRDVVLGLKDRLLAQGALDPEEEALIAALLETELDRPVTAEDAVEPRLRLLCGALLASPLGFLSLDAGAAGPVPALALGVEEACDRATTLLAAQGHAFSCAEVLP